MGDFRKAVGTGPGDGKLLGGASIEATLKIDETLFRIRYCGTR